MHASANNEPPAVLQKAFWIWPESHHWDIHNCYALFRKEFFPDLPDDGAPCLLSITADQSYQLFVNGSYVCRGPARGFQHHWSYDTVDIRPFLRGGRNVIAVRAHNPGRGNYQYISQGYAGLLVAGQFGNVSLVSDKTWKCRRQTGIRRDMVPVSNQLFTQEVIDCRIEDPDWMSPGYDDSSWSTKVACAAWNSMPWAHLTAREIPMLDEHPVVPRQVLGRADGPCARDSFSTRNLALTRYREGLAHEPVHHSPLPAGLLHFGPTGTGRWDSRLLDFGKTVVGSVLVEIDGAEGGEIVETHHYETLDADSLAVDFDPDFHAAFSNRLICRAGRMTHRFYWAFGFRYMLLGVRESQAPLAIRVSIQSAIYPMEVTGDFKCSDNALNSIWEACMWTQRVCSLDAFVDTPWREQAQWWGDARVQAWNTFHLSGDTRLFRRGIAQIASQTTSDGLTYGHAPTIAHHCVLPDFTLVWLITLWDYYWQTGSLEPFVTHQDTVRRALDYFQHQSSDTIGLVGHDPRYWLFLDWSDTVKEGYSSIYNLWLSLALKRMSQLYDLSSSGAEAKACREWGAKIDGVLQGLIDGEGLLRDGITFAGEPVRSTGVHAQTLAIMTGMAAPWQEEAMLKRRLLPALEPGAAGASDAPSSYWMTYVYSVLAERGHGVAVVNDIRRRWEPMAGYGTTWETFQPRRGVESFSHAWSAHPLFHLMQIVGGVRQTAPNWTKILYRPEFVGTHAHVKIPTPHGLVESSWRRDPESISGELRVPVAVRVDCRLGDAEIKPLADGNGFSFERTVTETTDNQSGASRSLVASCHN